MSSQYSYNLKEKPVVGFSIFAILILCGLIVSVFGAKISNGQKEIGSDVESTDLTSIEAIDEETLDGATIAEENVSEEASATPEQEIASEAVLSETEKAAVVSGESLGAVDIDGVAYYSLNDVINALKSQPYNRTVTLHTDITHSGVLLDFASNITLDLNGYTLNRGLSNASSYAEDGYGISVGRDTVNCPTTKESFLTIKDSSAAQTGTITGGYNHVGGGGVRIGCTGSVTMLGGRITGNRTTNGGGGVRANGDFFMYGGEIDHNSAGTSGGGIYVYSSNFVMTTGSIHDNTATDKAGGVYIDNYNNEYSIDTNGSFLGGSITNNKSGNIGGGVIANKPITIGGDLVVRNNIEFKDSTQEVNNIMLRVNAKSQYSPRLILSTETPLTENAEVGISTDSTTPTNIFSTSLTADQIKLLNNQIISDDNDSPFSVQNGNVVTTNADPVATLKIGDGQEVNCASFTDAWNAAKQSGGTIKLLSDVDLDYYIKLDNAVEVTLDLNGHTLNRGLTSASADGAVIYVGSADSMNNRIAAKLTIDDSSEDKNGTITGGYNTGCGGGIFVTAGAELTVNAGNIVNNISNDGGGGIYSSGTVKINGGKIDGNSAVSGGGIYIYAGNFEITDGLVQNNTANNKGGGVYIDNYNTQYNIPVYAAFLGGNINNNEAADIGGGVIANQAIFIGGDLVVKDNADSEGNRVNNVMLRVRARSANDPRFILSPNIPLTENAEIGVSTDTDITEYDSEIRILADNSGSELDLTSIISSDDDNFHVFKQDDEYDLLNSEDMFWLSCAYPAMAELEEDFDSETLAKFNEIGVNDLSNSLDEYVYDNNKTLEENETIFLGMAETAKSDANGALDAIDLINQIGEVKYDDETEEKINAAKEAYNELSNAAKALLKSEDVAKLNTAIETYEQLDEVQKQKEADEAKKAEAEKKAAEASKKAEEENDKNTDKKEETKQEADAPNTGENKIASVGTIASLGLAAVLSVISGIFAKAFKKNKRQ